MFQHILVPLDGSTLAEAILPHARAMAAAFDARVTLVHVLETPSRETVHVFDWHLRKAEAEAYLQEQVTCLQQAGLAVASELLEGPASERIVEYAGEQQADLIILSSHGQGGLSEWHVSHIAQKVLQRGVTSILLVRAGQSGDASPGEIRYRRILVPLDGSRRAECVLPAARMLVQQHATLLLAHVTTPPFVFRRLPFTAGELASMDWLVDHNRARAGKYLRQLARGIPSPVRTVLPVGDNVALTLHEMVREEAVDLLLFSAHGHSSQSQWAYGSVVSNFIAYGAVSLLIVQDLPQPLSQERELQAPRRQTLYGQNAVLGTAGAAPGSFPPHQEQQLATPSLK
jgi:nucleotide-binding universal stress UspA family protein